MNYSSHHVLLLVVINRPKEDIVRLPSPKTFNRYRTVESPASISKSVTVNTPQPAHGPSQQISSDPSPSQQSTSVTSAPDADGHPPLSRTRIPRNRKRFSFKERTRKVVHAAPPNAKQFKLKFYREPAQTNSVAAKKSKAKSNKTSSGPQKKSLSDMDKIGLVRSMSWYHPTSSLEIGTVRANAKRVAMEEEMQQEVFDCLQEAPRLAAGVKREAQRLIGHFVEMLRDRMDKVEEERRIVLESMTPPQTMTESYRLQCRKEFITDVEREILLSICQRIKPADIDEGEEDTGGNEENDNSDVEKRQDREFGFILSFLIYLYSGNYPKENSKSGGVANHLINWLVNDGIHSPVRTRNELQETAILTPAHLVRSVSGQLAAEVKRMYGYGARDLHNKVWAEVSLTNYVVYYAFISQEQYR